MLFIHIMLMIQAVNPEYADKESQKEEIAMLKDKMEEMSKNLAEIMKTNGLLVERLSNRSTVQ